MRPAEKGAVTLGHGSDIEARHFDFTGIGRVDAADEVQQRGFARATAASQGNRLAFDEIGAQFIQHQMPLFAFCEAAA